jgi:hypothetical protein
LDARQHTTTGGLYRYDINDIIRVTSHWNATPLIEFQQKGRGVTNITGEKLYETQVTQATADTAVQCSLTFPFFIVLADRNSGRYEFFFEISGPTVPDLRELGQLFDENLCRQNEEYKQKRASGRLQPAQAWLLKFGAATRFRAHLVKCGQREGQFKVQCLAYKDEVGFDFLPQVAAE